MSSKNSKRKSTKVTSMTSGNPAKLILLFALPMIAGNMFQQAYTLCDTAIVGQFLGVRALAAVGTADWFNWMILGSAIGFTQGFSIRIAQQFGAEDYTGLQKTLGSSIRLSIYLAIGFSILAQILVLPVLHWLNTPQELIPMGELYLRIIFGGIPIVFAYNTSSSFLRSFGNSRIPLIAMVIASVTNIGLDILFILAFHWGVAGAAIATIIAQLIAFLICFRALTRVPFLHLTREDFAADRSRDLGLLKLGAPLAFSNVVIAIGGMVLQGIVNGFGVLFIAGFTATNKMFGLLESAGISFGNAVGTYTGQNLGAKNYQRIKQGVTQSALLGIGVSVVIAGIMFFLGRVILSLFISGTPEDAAETMRIALRYLHFMASLLPVLYLLFNYRSALQGLGDTVTPMISGIVELVVRISVAVVLTRLIGSDGIFWAEIMAWVGAAVFLYIKYRLRIKKL